MNKTLICPDFTPPTLPGYTIASDKTDGDDRCILYEGPNRISLELYIRPGREFPFDYSLWRQDADDGETSLATGEGPQAFVDREAQAAATRLGWDPQARGLSLAEAQAEQKELRRQFNAQGGRGIELADRIDLLDRFIERLQTLESLKERAHRIRDDAVAHLNRARETLETIENPQGAYVYQTDIHTLETLIENIEGDEDADFTEA